MNINIKKKNRRQGGFTLLEFMVVMAVIAMVLLGIMALKNDAVYSSKHEEIVKQAQVVSGASDRWQKRRPNKTGVSMAVLCAAGAKLMDDSLCGAARDGKKANTFGGDITLVANTANSSLVDITFTGLPADYITDIADSLAAISNARCQSATGCSAITVTGTSVKVTM
ncbi:type II secretion system protein [Aeromonas hydrophila]|uniref:type II secretion system protein n=1 Tax=Aeromonas hydrophila TaxID=644 RepID=UPI003EC8DA9F